MATGALKEQIAAFLRDDSPPQERLAQVWEQVDRETVDRFLFCDPAAARLNRRLWQESGLVNRGDMSRALATQPMRVPSAADLARVTAPTLVLVGRHDRNVGVDACLQLCAAITNARLLIFEQSAHFPDIEEPDTYAAVVRDFLLLDRTS